MTAGRCQICGRRKGLKLGGTVVAHYVGGLQCPGSGYAPLEQSDARLERYCEILRQLAGEARYELRRLRESRANYIPPALVDRIRMLDTRRERLERRLDRLRAWPARYRRQMAERGWADAPPDYLIRRADAEAEAGRC